MTRPLCWYQVQSHLSKLRSNIKVTVFEKMAVAGALVFYIHILLERSSDLSNSGEFKRQTASDCLFLA